jgi:acetoin utilization protein AcuC
VKHSALMVYGDAFLRYRFHDSHPFQPKRIQLTLDLIRSFGWIEEDQLIAPRRAADKELARTHEESFIETVKQAPGGALSTERLEACGLGTEDNPVFPGMHEAAATVVGGTLVAAEQVMSGKCEHALNLAGGLHHALRGRASGFCIYNDAAVAIAWLRKEYDARVLYIDTDAHHGDGVQWAFYDDPQVMTISIHETGKYLFPGTGSVYERGQGPGFGTSINLPLDAFTEDESWLDAFRRVVPEAARRFRPDVILSQNGCDAHRYDPLTHLSATMRIYREIPRTVHQLAHELCDGRWIAVGGGGYDMWRVVPRAWTWLWAEMNDCAPEEAAIPAEWLKRWQPESPVDLPQTLHDPDGLFAPIPRRAEITEKNRRTADQILQMIQNHL